MLDNQYYMRSKKNAGYTIIHQWLQSKELTPFLFQEQAWQQIIDHNSGLVNAPTGCGKTYSVFLGALIQFINQYPESYCTKKNNGLQLLWITPLRALAKDIARAMEEVITELGMQWQVGKAGRLGRVALYQQQLPGAAHRKAHALCQQGCHGHS